MFHTRLRRRVAFLAGIWLAGLLFAACGDMVNTPTVVPPLSPTPALPPAPLADAPIPPGSDITTILAALHLPRLDGVTLRVMVWSGSYKNLLTTFGRVTGATMKISEINSTDEQLSYLGTSGPIPFDVMTVQADIIPSNVEQGRLAPVNMQQVPHYRDIMPSLLSSTLGLKDGKHYTVPTYWGYEGILYDPTTFASPPNSWEVFWDPQYKGQIAIWDDVEFLDCVGLLLGFGGADPTAIYNLSDAQLAQAKAKIQALKAQDPIYFQDPADLTALMAQGKVKLAFGWLVNAADLQDQGHDIRMTYPAAQGTVFWAEALAVSADSPQKAAAFTLINTILAPPVQAWLADRNYTVANVQAVQYFTPEQIGRARRIFNLDLHNLVATTGQIAFQVPTPRRTLYNETWNSAKLGP